MISFETGKHDQSERIEFDTQFKYLMSIIARLAKGHVRHLLTNVSVSSEFALTFEAGYAKAAREVCPEIFPDEKKRVRGDFGKTIYFKYK